MQTQRAPVYIFLFLLTFAFVSVGCKEKKKEDHTKKFKSCVLQQFDEFIEYDKKDAKLYKGMVDLKTSVMAPSPMHNVQTTKAGIEAETAKWEKIDACQVKLMLNTCERTVNPGQVEVVECEPAKKPAEKKK